jgi:sugar lactone lactonase YvrE
MKKNRKNSKSIAAGSPSRSFDSTRKAKGLIRAALSIATLTASLAAPLALHAQSVSFAGIQTTVPAQGLGKTTAVAVDGSGNLFIADNNNHRIVKVAPSGVQTVLLNGNVFDITQLAVDSAGNLFILDDGTPGSIYLATPQIKEYTTAGSLITIMSQGMGDAQGLAIDNAEDILADNDTIGANYVDWAPYGTPPSAWHTVYNPVNPDPDLPPPTPNPANLAMGPFNPASGIQNVFIPFTASGQVLGVPGYFSSGKVSYNQSQQFTVASGLNNPLGVVADQTGNVFISNTSSNSILEVPMTGTNSSGLPTYGSQIRLPVSGLNHPYGLAMDGAGNLYIADQDNSRIVDMQLHSVNFDAVNICPSGQTSPAPCSNTISIPFNVTASGSVSPRLLLQGQPWTSSNKNADFSVAPGSTCVGNVAAGTTCTVNVTFAPKFAGLRPAAIQLVSNSGAILSTNLLYGYGEGPQVAFNQAAQTTAVSGVPNPTSVAVDASGDVYVAQENGTVMEFIDGSKGIVASGLGGADNLTVDGAGNVYIADPNNNQVLEVTPKNGQTTVGAGLLKPRGVAVDGEGNVFIADSNNNRVVKVLGGTGVQSTVGTGLNLPSAVAVDGLGDVYIADTGNSRVVDVSANGVQTTIASGLPNPISVALDAAGDVYVVDASSSVVEISPNGTQSTLGSGLSEPSGVALDGAGDLFISDYTNNRVVEVEQSKPQGLSFSTPVNTGTVQSMTVQNIGNQPLNASGLSVSGANFEQVEDTSSLEDCYNTISLAGGASCNLSIKFSQSSTGSFSGSAVLTDNTSNSTSASQTINLAGTATAQ